MARRRRPNYAYLWQCFVTKSTKAIRRLIYSKARGLRGEWIQPLWSQSVVQLILFQLNLLWWGWCWWYLFCPWVGLRSIKLNFDHPSTDWAWRKIVQRSPIHRYSSKENYFPHILFTPFDIQDAFCESVWNDWQTHVFWRLCDTIQLRFDEKSRWLLFKWCRFGSQERIRS